MNIFNKIKGDKVISFIIILIIFFLLNIIYSVDFGIPIIKFFVGLIGSAVSYVCILFIIDWFIKVFSKSND